MRLFTNTTTSSLHARPGSSFVASQLLLNVTARQKGDCVGSAFLPCSSALTAESLELKVAPTMRSYNHSNTICHLSSIYPTSRYIYHHLGRHQSRAVKPCTAPIQIRHFGFPQTSVTNTHHMINYFGHSFSQITPVRIDI